MESRCQAEPERCEQRDQQGKPRHTQVETDFPGARQVLPGEDGHGTDTAESDQQTE